MVRPLCNRREPDVTARYTLFIGSKNWSSWSLRPWLAMKMAHIPFEEVLERLRTSETKARILAHSPSGKVPALKIEGDGPTIVVWDSLAICETIAERHPKTMLWPSDPGLRAEARSIVAEMHSGFPELRKVLPMEVAARHPTPALSDAVQAEIARVIAIWTSALGRNREGGFLFGPFTIADAFYAPVVTRFETYGVHLPAASQAYAQRILALAPMHEWHVGAKLEAHRIAAG
ncbi:MAG TPA: glutathione S-transferase family protein [Micropepsaceae bacterium]|nr:glutathione S-transferase family protein [Micropepsaceae bacterium]